MKKETSVLCLTFLLCLGRIDCQYTSNGMLGMLASGNSYHGSIGNGIVNRGGYGGMSGYHGFVGTQFNGPSGNFGRMGSNSYGLSNNFGTGINLAGSSSNHFGSGTSANNHFGGGVSHVGASSNHYGTGTNYAGAGSNHFSVGSGHVDTSMGAGHHQFSGIQSMGSGHHQAVNTHPHIAGGNHFLPGQAHFVASSNSQVNGIGLNGRKKKGGAQHALAKKRAEKFGLNHPLVPPGVDLSEDYSTKKKVKGSRKRKVGAKVINKDFDDDKHERSSEIYVSSGSEGGDRRRSRENNQRHMRRPYKERENLLVLEIPVKDEVMIEKN